MIDYPNKLNPLFNKLYKYNAEPIIVGGYVRDYLLNIESKDIDIEVYNISSFNQLEDILGEFGVINSVGKSFGVCKLLFEGLDLDFSLPRTDSKTGVGHSGFEININPNLDFKTAASRRDFTINSIGFDIKQRKIIDPFNGRSDLKNRLLKVVDKDKFAEDPLRVLRAARFSARYDLSIDKELFGICKNMVNSKLLVELPRERIFEEIKKLLLKSKKPSIGFNLLKEFGYDIYSKNIHVLDKMSELLTSNEQTNTVLMLAAMYHDCTPINALKLIQKLTSEKEISNRVIPLVINSSEIDKIVSSGMNNYALYKLATKVKISELLILTRAIHASKDDVQSYEAFDMIEKKAKELHVLDEKLPEYLKGGDILNYGLKPSPKFSEILHVAYEAQMKGEFNNREMALKWLRSYLT
jgi:tRNA nucleotidyltransferase (CCA-adding enzyme)